MSSKETQIYMPKPANNSFYDDIVVTFSKTGVSDVKGTSGNESLNQSKPFEVELQVKDFQGTKTLQTIKIKVEH